MVGWESRGRGGIAVSMTRRKAVSLAAAGGGVAALGAGGYWAYRSFSSADLMQPGPLGEQALGDPKAPVIMIEYASLTCPHCARFAREVFPRLDEQYIRAGKVRYILREFPFDVLGAGVFTLAHCAGKDNYFAVVDKLFQSQETWLVDQPMGPLRTVFRDLGLTDAGFDACLDDQTTVDGITWVRDRAFNEFKVNATPTFFINGKMYVGGMTFDELDKIVRPLT
jgi:protein-disulfide isomerase